MVPAPRTRARGFTLIEASVVLAVSVLLASVALPSFSDQLVRSRRVDATAALQKLQWAQERHRERHGRYAERLDELRGAPAGRSEQGHYIVELRSLGPDAYEAVAHAQAQQARDTDCRALTLQVRGVLSQREPQAKCWGP
jgi:type IV pilus assembly protein PilE